MREVVMYLVIVCVVSGIIAAKSGMKLHSAQVVMAVKYGAIDNVQREAVLR